MPQDISVDLRPVNSTSISIHASDPLLRIDKSWCVLTLFLGMELNHFNGFHLP